MKGKLAIRAQLTLSALFIASLVFAPSAQARRSLAEQVTIGRNNNGVAHILGETEEADAFGMGTLKLKTTALKSRGPVH